LDLVALRQRVKEWLLKRIIPLVESHSGQDTIVTTRDQDGKQGIGHVELGKNI